MFFSVADIVHVSEVYLVQLLDLQLLVLLLFGDSFKIGFFSVSRTINFVMKH